MGRVRTNGTRSVSASSDRRADGHCGRSGAAAASDATSALRIPPIRHFPPCFARCGRQKGSFAVIGAPEPENTAGPRPSTTTHAAMKKLSSFFRSQPSSSRRREPSPEPRPEEARWQRFPNDRVHSARLEPTRYQGVYLDHDSDDEFKDRTRGSLDLIGSTPSGSTVLQHLASINEMNPRKKVIIQPDGVPPRGSHVLPGWERPGHSFSELRQTLYARETSDAFMPRVASDGCDVSVVTYNPEHGERFDGHDANAAHGVQDASLSYAYLGHELIHASRKLHGEELQDPDNLHEELRTAGVGPWSNEYPSENALRRERGVAARPSYSGETGSGIHPDGGNSAATEDRLETLGAWTGYPHGWRHR